MRRLSVWIDLIGMGQALAGHGPASGPASGARKRSGRTLQRPRPWWSSRNACEQFSAEMLESGQFPSRARSRAHSGVRRSPLVHWRLLTRLLHSPVVVWSWFCDIKITIPPPTGCKNWSHGTGYRRTGPCTIATSHKQLYDSGECAGVLPEVRALLAFFSFSSNFKIAAFQPSACSRSCSGTH